MPIYQPTELRAFLSEYGLQPKKGLSQNFLIDGNIVRKIIALSTASPGDVIVEIGPGPGSLTEQLLQMGLSLLAIEKDAVLAEALERFSTIELSTLHIHTADIMEFPLEVELKKLLKNGKPAKVIANLPYHLTTPILSYLIPLNTLFSSLTLMVQDEVAKRICAPPGSSIYGSLTVFLDYYSTAVYGFKVSKNSFYPTPEVDSSVIHFRLHPPPFSDPKKEHAFFKLTRTAFGQRRKMVKSTLKELYPVSSVESALKRIGASPLARPEELSLEHFLSLFQILENPLS